MRITTISALIAVTVFGSIAFLRAASDESVTDPQRSTSSKILRESPFACDRMAMTPEVRKRHFEELGPTLLRLKKSTRELADGYEFEFPADEKTFQLLAEWTIQERLCCPFFDINVRLEREGGPLWLRLTGREGTKDFIRADGAAWIRQ
jgi:hypothetical protein